MLTARAAKKSDHVIAYGWSARERDQVVPHVRGELDQHLIRAQSLPQGAQAHADWQSTQWELVDEVHNTHEELQPHRAYNRSMSVKPKKLVDHANDAVNTMMPSTKPRRACRGRR